MAANLYLLPCPQCQHPLELASRQAGQSVHCSECEHSFEAPRLGELKQLKQVDSSQSPSKVGAQSSMLKRWLFTLGLAMTVLLGAAGVGVYQFASSIQQEIDADGAMQNIDARLEEMSDAEIYHVAASYDTKDSIGEYFQPGQVKGNKQGEILKIIAYGLLGLAAAGLLMLIGSFLVK